jgi:hypothetical protein
VGKNTFSPGEKEGPIAQQWEDEGFGCWTISAGTPHPPKLRLGPSLSLRER